ncbi:uncharacterized protein LOC110889344 [Helianthus annuus]|uniref:uncharacterized protein LOC110889344 n=1 Tax=Helianthus annuus TaxID=4232 RepID=UPI000B8F529B|nr:uncharacterized protein LOC110889344 [Helianthus annuus]
MDYSYFKPSDMDARHVKPPDILSSSSNPNKGFATRLLNIDGKTFCPRRGVVSDQQQGPKVVNVIDELTKITVPVNLNAVDHDVVKPNAVHDEVFWEASKEEKTVSYAEKVQSTRKKREVNFRLLEPKETRDDADIVIPKEVVQQVQDKFDNVLYGYFLGNRLPFPVVEYYAKNVWAKFGFSKLMMNTSGFFFFKFDSKEGLTKVLEGGPWLIRKVPLFLNIWSPKVTLKKDSIKTVPIWVKLHNVPISVYTDDGLSLLASKLGVPKRLDSYTADMCVENWGRSSYARAMIELNADNELKDHITIAIPKMDEDGFILERVKVEYEWRPLRCSTCCLFGHDDNTCSKKPNGKAKMVTVDEEGFVTDKRKMARYSFPQKKQKPKVVYKPKTNKYHASTSGTKGDNSAAVQLSNSFAVLDNDKNNEKRDPTSAKSMIDENHGTRIQQPDEVKELNPTEMADFMSGNMNNQNSEGASTPGDNESHVAVNKLNKICEKIFRNWKWTSNGGVCHRGTRVILGWNADDIDLMVISQSDQVIHAQVLLKSVKKKIFCSFVYAENKYQDRRSLWADLCNFKGLTHDTPWVVMGDFNAALNMEDFTMGPSSHIIAMREFYDCVQEAKLIDVKSHGLHYTWNQKPKDGVGMLKKIDRIMGNIKLLDVFSDAYAMFQPFRVSDHAPAILKLFSMSTDRPKPFKFPNFIVTKPEFRQAVMSEWTKTVEGATMFSVVKKMKGLKSHFRRILRNQGNLHKRVTDLRNELDQIQKQVEAHPFDSAIRSSETICLRDFKSAVYDEECFLKQKSKVQWLCAGDSNTSYFHNSVKSRNARNRINCIKDTNGNQYEGVDVAAALLNHYSAFMGTEDKVARLDDADLFVNVLQQNVAETMVRQVTDDEVKQAMFSISENKAPGPDGYTSAFFKNAWDVVGGEVTKAVCDFFNNGQILKQINHTILALVPKMDTPNTVLDYRPISCCNVIYKCISKIITNRVKGCLGTLVNINQSAFVPGRKISDNILITQELMHNYHVDRGPPRCALKIDIQKAYDTVSWSFLEAILVRFGFHRKMVAWIMACVTTVSYSVSVNGELHGYFSGKRGLRQGDPMSPYLFTLIMEVLSLMLQKMALNPAFKFHSHCSKQKIINVSFADDLFVFVNGDTGSVKLVQKVLEKFTSVSGLVPSLPKSTVFFCNVPSQVKAEILSLLPFREGELLVCYLGVPLISTKLSFRDCWVLVERMERKVDNWMSKLLSFAELVDANGNWRWPQAWYDLFPVLINVMAPSLVPDSVDRLGWREVGGKIVHFSSWEAWNNLRVRDNKVAWVNMVWYGQCIPRHSFHLWLVLKNKLKTQDRLAVWEAGSETNLRLMCCPLCNYGRDSRDHLFFQCSYAAKIWSIVKEKVDMVNVNDSWSSIMAWIELNASSKTLEHIVCKLVVAASTYFIWQERNNRLFSNIHRKEEMVAQIILDMVRLRIMSFKIGRHGNYRKLLETWGVREDEPG